MTKLTNRRSQWNRWNWFGLRIKTTAGQIQTGGFAILTVWAAVWHSWATGILPKALLVVGCLLLLIGAVLGKRSSPIPPDRRYPTPDDEAIALEDVTKLREGTHAEAQRD